MVEQAVFDVVRRIYEASYTPSVWPDVLTHLSNMTESHALFLLYQDRAHPEARLHVARGVPRKVQRAYVNDYHALDPLLDPNSCPPPPGVVTADHKLCMDRCTFESRHADFFNGFMLPNDFWHFAGARLFVDQHRNGELRLFRRRCQSAWPDHHLDRVSALLPHLQHSLRIHRRFVQLRQRERALYAAMEQVVMGMALIDRHGRVIYQNPTARAVISRHPAICERDGELRATYGEDSEELCQAIRKAATAGGTPASSATALGLNHPDARLPLPIFVTPINPNILARLPAPEPVAAAVFLSDPDRSPPVASESLQAAYNLTKSEAEVAISIANGCSPEDIAQARQASLHTVRAQLKQVFRKLGVTKQADLVRILLAGPFQPPEPPLN